ncbi:MAG: uncultured phage MedDCM-OCT-S46-C10 [Bacteroidota bacterium]|jgi:uncharacterized coiled-coil DUF342 family protein
MRKKHKTISNTAVRLSSHEKLCAERMAQLIKTIDELRADVKDLREYMNKNKGAVALVIIIGSVVGAVAGAIASFFHH